MSLTRIRFAVPLKGGCREGRGRLENYGNDCCVKMCALFRFLRFSFPHFPHFSLSVSAVSDLQFHLWPERAEGGGEGGNNGGFKSVVICHTHIYLLCVCVCVRVCTIFSIQTRQVKAHKRHTEEACAGQLERASGLNVGRQREGVEEGASGSGGSCSQVHKHKIAFICCFTLPRCCYSFCSFSLSLSGFCALFF